MISTERNTCNIESNVHRSLLENAGNVQQIAITDFEFDQSCQNKSLLEKLMQQSPLEANATLWTVLTPEKTGESPTEMRNKKSEKLNEMSSEAICKLMLQDAIEANYVLFNHMTQISQLISKVVDCLRSGGRLLYVGAGNSGRLAVLDAAECPATFGCTANQVQAILAGGRNAIDQEIEGVEDNALGGLLALGALKPTLHDFVLGISASGHSAFVWGALFAAQQASAQTALISFNPNFRPRIELKHLIQIDCGPEVLTGSTRLKCGTLTKMVLNMISTSVMVQLGKCISNLMVDVQPTNVKLKQRLANILMTIINGENDQKISSQFAHDMLQKHDYQVRAAIEQLKN